MSEKEMELWSFICKKIPIAFLGNPTHEYSIDEYQQSETLIKPFLGYLDGQDEELLYKVFACLIRAIKTQLKSFEEIKDTDFIEKGKVWQEYHKMMLELNRVIQSFAHNYEIKTEEWGEIFPIKEVIFKGEKKEQEIKLSGEILGIVSSLFKAINPNQEFSDPKKDFTSGLYRALEEFKMELQIQDADPGTIAKAMVKSREESSKDTALILYRNQICYSIHFFLKANSLPNVKANIPSWHCKLIGTLLSDFGLVEYLGYTDNGKIQLFIQRGNPENITITKKA